MPILFFFNLIIDSKECPPPTKKVSKLKEGQFEISFILHLFHQDIGKLLSDNSHMLTGKYKVFIKDSLIGQLSTLTDVSGRRARATRAQIQCRGFQQQYHILLAIETGLPYRLYSVRHQSCYVSQIPEWQLHLISQLQQRTEALGHLEAKLIYCDLIYIICNSIRSVTKTSLQMECTSKFSSIRQPLC